jgi:hypothetical protein
MNSDDNVGGEGLSSQHAEPSEDRLNEEQMITPRDGEISHPSLAEDSDNSDDEYYENPADIIREFGNNPLMER